MDRSLLLYDTALGVLCIGLRSLLAEINALDNRALLRHLNLQDFTLLALVVTGDHQNRIPLLNMQFN